MQETAAPTSKVVIATLRAVGFHAWPDAPKDVGYLALRHRHVFTFRVGVRVDGLDRDAEFHQMQRNMRMLFDGYESRSYGEYEFADRSCEHLALEMREHMQEWYDVASVEVWEDDENGSRLEWE